MAAVDAGLALARQGADDIEVPQADVGASSAGCAARARARAASAPNTWRRSPGAAGREGYVATLKADVVANMVRNVWSYAIIFCGHFPDQTYTFSQKEVEDETPGRLVRAPARRRGQHRGRSDLPHRQRQPRLPGGAPPIPRHAEHALCGDRAEQVKGICEKYELPYNTGPFLKQLGMVQQEADPPPCTSGRQDPPQARSLQGWRRHLPI